MKTTILLFSVVGLFLLTGCNMETSRYITEKYIKTNVEDHQEGHFSAMKAYPVYFGSAPGGGYLEMTGYIYGTHKLLVIGADRFYSDRRHLKNEVARMDSIAFVELSMEQCKAMVDKFKVIENVVKYETPNRDEIIYHDYNVSKELFISLKNTHNHPPQLLDVWVKGDKFQVDPFFVLQGIEKLMEY